MTLKLMHLERIRKAKGHTQKALAALAGVGNKTIVHAEKMNPVSQEIATELARALGVKVEELSDAVSPWVAPMFAGNWRATRLGPTMTSANGLQWRICDLENRHQPGSRARGKLYDLNEQITDNRRQDMKAYLMRHAEVCNLVRSNTNIARHRDTFPDASSPAYWWVIDEWLDGPTLEAALERKLDIISSMRHRLKCLAQIANGLKALHAAGIVRRDLAPRWIVVEPGRAVLTDFELAKLVDGGVTVRGDAPWPDSVYRAPEAGGPGIGPRADVFSWGVIGARLLSPVPIGNLRGAQSAVRASPVAKQEKDLLLQSLSLSPSKRPADGAALRKIMRRWDD